MTGAFNGNRKKKQNRCGGASASSGVWHPCRMWNKDKTYGGKAGIDVELMKEACSRGGFEPVLKEIDISERFSSLAEGSVDCLWSALTMDGRFYL